MADTKGWEEGGNAKVAGEAAAYRTGNETGELLMEDRKKSGTRRKRRVSLSPRPPSILGRESNFAFLIWSHYVVQAGHKLPILLPQPPQCSDYPQQDKGFNVKI